MLRVVLLVSCMPGIIQPSNPIQLGTKKVKMGTIGLHPWTLRNGMPLGPDRSHLSLPLSHACIVRLKDEDIKVKKEDENPAQPVDMPCSPTFRRRPVRRRTAKGCRKHRRNGAAPAVTFARIRPNPVPRTLPRRPRFLLRPAANHPIPSRTHFPGRRIAQKLLRGSALPGEPHSQSVLFPWKSPPFRSPGGGAHQPCATSVWMSETTAGRASLRYSAVR